MCSFIVVTLISCNNRKPEGIHGNNTESLRVKNKTCNLGNLSKKDNHVIDFSFDIENVSNVPIVIDKIDVSCGCVFIEKIRKPISAHKFIKLKGNINIQKQEGYFSKSIYLNYSNGNVMLLKVKGIIN